MPEENNQQNQMGGMNAMLQFIQALFAGKNQQLQQLLPAVTNQQSKIVRKDMRGNVIQQGQQRPGGLAGFYHDNPNLRRGEFDPTGGKALARGQQAYQRQDRLQALDHNNAYAKGLLDLFNTQQQFNAGDNPQSPAFHSVFNPLSS